MSHYAPHPTRKARKTSVAVTTSWRLNPLELALLISVFTGFNRAEAQDVGNFPSFRHVDAVQADVAPQEQSKIVLLADADFAPWSFVADDGTLTGLSVDIAEKACVAAKLECSFVAKPFAELLPALRKGEGQGIVSGVRIDATLAKEFAVTRPYYQSLARFVVRKGSPLTAVDVRSLADRKIGVLEKSTHAKFLQKFYQRSTIMPFATQETMLEALRTGQLDAGFGDSVQLSFWLSGSQSKNCCATLGKAFLHRDSFTKSLAFLMSRGDASLRNRMDAALDDMESSGATAAAFARYLPPTVW